MFIRFKTKDNQKAYLVPVHFIKRISIDDKAKDTFVEFMDNTSIHVVDGFNELSDAIALNKFKPKN